jgi:hypothetical protein
MQRHAPMAPTVPDTIGELQTDAKTALATEDIQNLEGVIMNQFSRGARCLVVVKIKAVK